MSVYPFSPTAPVLDSSGVAVLLFHGVIPDARYPIRNYTGKHILASEFERLLKDLLTIGTPVSMDDVTRHVEGGEPCPPRSFTVTLDDGFRNNLTVAAPILRSLQVPATVYVTTDFVDFNRMSWVDRIEAAVAQTPRNEVTAPAPLSGSHGLVGASSRIAFMKEVRRVVKGGRAVDAEHFADQLVESLVGSAELERVTELDDKLSWEDSRELNADELFTIGCHSRTHRILGNLTEEESRDEIDYSLQRLTTELSPERIHFSFPEGFAGSFRDTDVETLQQRGVASCVTTIPGYARAGDPPLRLGRFFVA